MSESESVRALAPPGYEPSLAVSRSLSRADLRFHSLRSYLTFFAPPLGTAKGPIRYQNNSHLFVVRRLPLPLALFALLRVVVMKCRRMQ